MSIYREICGLIKGLNLPEEQAAPILVALETAESDYSNLCYLYRQAQELHYLMRDIPQVRPSKHTEAIQRADRQWQVVRSILEQFALDEEHPGRGE